MAKLYWYFSTANRRLRYWDDREIVLGGLHSVPGEPVLCEYGLHASADALDALKYAPGPVVWRVKLGGQIVQCADKACAQTREYVAGGIDVSNVFRKFARDCALDVAHLWNMPDVVRRYLKTGREDLRAEARDAAYANYANYANAAYAANANAAYTAAYTAANAAYTAANAYANAAYAAAAANAAYAAAAKAAYAAAAAAAKAAYAASAKLRDKQNRRLTRALLSAVKGENA